MTGRARLLTFLLAFIAITTGHQTFTFGQSESDARPKSVDADAPKRVRRPQTPDEAIELLMLGARGECDVGLDSLLPDQYGAVFREAQEAARSQIKACKRLAEAMKEQGFGKEGEELADAILRPSQPDRWKQWKKLKIVDKKQINNARIMLTVEWTHVDAEAGEELQISEIKFLTVKAADGWRLLPDAFEPDEEQLAKMRIMNEEAVNETAQIKRLAAEVAAGRLKNVKQVEDAIILIGSRK